jgi:hypothetical protein
LLAELLLFFSHYMCVLYIHKVNIVDAVFLVVVIVKLQYLSSRTC